MSDNLIRFPLRKRLLTVGSASRGPATIIELDLYRHRKTPLAPTPRRKSSKSASA